MMRTYFEGGKILKYLVSNSLHTRIFLDNIITFNKLEENIQMIIQLIDLPRKYELD